MQSTYMIIFGVVRQSRESAPAPEFGAPGDDGGCGRLRYKQVGRVCVTHL